MTLKRLILSVVVGALGVWASTATTFAAELRMLSSWDSRMDGRRIIADAFAERVQETSSGAVEITISGPEVVPPFEQIQPVSAGVFDLLFSHGAYHAGSKGLVLALDAVDPDPAKRREAGVFAFVDEFYQDAHGLKLISLSSMGTGGYNIILREPLSAGGDLDGRKIRGHPGQHGVIRALGASPVGLPGGEIYQALEKGVIDGAAWASIGPLDFKWYEVASYIVRPTFGVVTLPIFMNLEKFNSLTDEEKRILLEAGKAVEKNAVKEGDTVLEKEEEELDRLGMETVKLPDDMVRKVREAWADSTWSLAEDCCGDAAVELRALAVEHGLSR